MRTFIFIVPDHVVSLVSPFVRSDRRSAATHKKKQLVTSGDVNTLPDVSVRDNSVTLRLLVQVTSIYLLFVHSRGFVSEKCREPHRQLAIVVVHHATIASST